MNSQPLPEFTPADLGYSVIKGPRPFNNRQLSSTTYQIPSIVPKAPPSSTIRLMEEHIYKTTNDSSVVQQSQRSQQSHLLKKSRFSHSETRLKVTDLIDKCKTIQGDQALHGVIACVKYESGQDFKKI